MKHTQKGFIVPLLIIVVAALVVGAIIFRSKILPQSRTAAVADNAPSSSGGTTYYVSPHGNDANNGTSQATPWRTIGKVNAVRLHPGDKVLFEGGQVFNGSLRFDSGDSGTVSNRVVISSYGNGKATISSGTSRGAYVLDGSGITFDNLKFVGTPGDVHFQDGIRIENYRGNGVLSGFTVSNCDISGYAEAGIVFGSDSAAQGMNNVSITNNEVYNNVAAGIESFAVSTFTNTNVYIARNLVHDNYGDGVSFNSGNGIMLEGLNGATIEYNSAYHNGAIGGNGGVGIWCYLSNNVTFQYNQSYNNKTTRGDDGDGFDFDADTSNSIMQYNFAADNDGGGYELDQWHDNTLSNNLIVRYNVSQNNGKKNNYSGIDVWGRILNAQIYGNVVYTTPAISGQDSAIRISNNTISNLYPENISVSNNIFLASGSLPIVNFYSAAYRGAKNVTFTGNVYYNYKGAVDISWGGRTYTTLASFQSGAGQEKNSGLFADPMLQAPGQAVASNGGYSNSYVSAYSLQGNSPVKNAGLTANGNTASGGGSTSGGSSGGSTGSTGSGGTTNTPNIIRVQVNDDAGAPVVFATVSINTSSGQSPVVTHTDPTGRTDSSTPANPYAIGSNHTITVSMSGYASVTANIDVTQAINPITIVLHKSAVTQSGPGITMLTPAGNSTIKEGVATPITWKSENISSSQQIKITLFSSASSYSTIATVSNSGSYTWKPSTSITPGRYAITVSESNNTAISNSTGVFTISR